MSKRRRSDCSSLSNKTVCAFCGLADNDEILYGELIVSDSITVHADCMFFASGLIQKGVETDELYGFRLPDIEAELRRGKKLFCAYCRKRGATIGCCELKCKKSFHLNCGIKRGCLQQFYGSFRSYCADHRFHQKLLQNQAERFCYICCEDISEQELASCLYSPCCKKNWFHKICLQKYATSAGYFFKCPLCNNSEEFIKEMKFYGIRIPQKDASWELEENAFEDLLVKPECGVEICKCPKGRNYSSTKKSGWLLLSCTYCGYYARHKNCEKMNPKAWTWICEECTLLEKEMKENKASAVKINNDEAKPCEIFTTDIKLKENKASAVKINNEVKRCEIFTTDMKCVPSSSRERNSTILQNVNRTLSVELDLFDMTNPLMQNFASNYRHLDKCGDNKTVSSESLDKKICQSSNFLHLYNEFKNFKQAQIFSNSENVVNVMNKSSKKKPFGKLRIQPTKKDVKKRKADSFSCSSCNNSNHNCIKKYFSPKLESYHV